MAVASGDTRCVERNPRHESASEHVIRGTAPESTHPDMSPRTQASCEIVESWAHVRGTTTSSASEAAVVSAQSFWDYASVSDEYAAAGGSAGSGETYKATGRCFSVGAGRISFTHGFTGPTDYEVAWVDGRTFPRAWRTAPIASALTSAP